MKMAVAGVLPGLPVQFCAFSEDAWSYVLPSHTETARKSAARRTDESNVRKTASRHDLPPFSAQ